METTTNPNTQLSNSDNEHTTHRHRGHVWTGAALIVIGAVFMTREMGADIPHWIFSWQMILVTIGVFSGARHAFRIGGWIILILVGVAFLLDDYIPGIDIGDFFLPIILIGAGLFMLFRPRRKRHDRWNKRYNHWTNWNHNATSTNDDSGEVLDVVSVFSSTKRNIITKSFKGGDVVTVIGGTDLILSQADFTGTVTLELTQVFGGTNLIIPASWKIQSEVVSIFGSLEDKRPQSADVAVSDKVLKLIGTSIFGSITIKSY